MNNKKKVIPIIIFTFGIFLIILGLIVNQLEGPKTVFMTSYKHLSNSVISLSNLENLNHLNKVFVNDDYEIMVDNTTIYDNKNYNQKLFIQKSDVLKGSLSILKDTIDFELSDNFLFRLNNKEYLIPLDENYLEEVEPKRENIRVVLDTIEKVFKKTLNEKDFKTTKENKLTKHTLLITEDLNKVFLHNLNKLKEDDKVLEAFEDIDFDIEDLEKMEITFSIKGFNNLVEVQLIKDGTTIRFENNDKEFNISFEDDVETINIIINKDFNELKFVSNEYNINLNINSTKESDKIEYKIIADEKTITGSLIITSSKKLSEINNIESPKNIENLEPEEYMELFIDFLSLEIFDELKLDELFEM